MGKKTSKTRPSKIRSVRFTGEQEAIIQHLSKGLDLTPSEAIKAFMPRTMTQSEMLVDMITHRKEVTGDLSTFIWISVATWLRHILRNYPDPKEDQRVNWSLIPAASELDELCRFALIWRRSWDREPGYGFLDSRLPRSENDNTRVPAKVPIEIEKGLQFAYMLKQQSSALVEMLTGGEQKSEEDKIEATESETETTEETSL